LRKLLISAESKVPVPYCNEETLSSAAKTFMGVNVTRFGGTKWYIVNIFLYLRELFKGTQSALRPG